MKTQHHVGYAEGHIPMNTSGQFKRRHLIMMMMMTMTMAESWIQFNQPKNIINQQGRAKTVLVIDNKSVLIENSKNSTTEKTRHPKHICSIDSGL